MTPTRAIAEADEAALDRLLEEAAYGLAIALGDEDAARALRALADEFERSVQ